MPNAARVVEIIGSVKQLECRFPILLCLLRLKGAEIDLDPNCCQLIGRALETDPTEVQQVASWVESLMLDDQSVVHRCVSISCTSNGAQELWDLIEPEVAALNLTSQFKAVHCLARCGMGPCLGRDENIYLGQNEAIHLDDRPWREAPVDQDQ